MNHWIVVRRLDVDGQCESGSAVSSFPLTVGGRLPLPGQPASQEHERAPRLWDRQKHAAIQYILR